MVIGKQHPSHVVEAAEDVDEHLGGVTGPARWVQIKRAGLVGEWDPAGVASVGTHDTDLQPRYRPADPLDPGFAERTEGRVAGDEDRPLRHLGGVGAHERDPAAVGAPGRAAIVDRARIAVGGERDRAPRRNVEDEQVPAQRAEQSAFIGRERVGVEAHARGHRHRPQAAAGRLVEPVIAPRDGIGMEQERAAARRQTESVDHEPLGRAGGEERIASDEHRAFARGGVVAGDLGRGSFSGLELQSARAIGEPGGVERPAPELVCLHDRSEPQLDLVEEAVGRPSWWVGRRRRSRQQGGGEAGRDRDAAARWRERPRAADGGRRRGGRHVGLTPASGRNASRSRSPRSAGGTRCRNRSGP